LIPLRIVKLSVANVAPEKSIYLFIAELLQGDREELLTFWLAEQVTAMMADDKELSDKALSIAKEKIDKKAKPTKP
jgi:hypothetical protein